MALRVSQHSDANNGFVIYVKTHGMSFREGGTDDQRNRAWELATEEFWINAGIQARLCGFGGVSAVGRSGGWLAPYYEIPGKRAVYVSSEDNDDFIKLKDMIEQDMADVPQLFSDKLDEVIEDDKIPTLDDLLENWTVDAPGLWENDSGPKDWYAVSNDDEGIVAYFEHEKDAFGFRLYKINQILNG